MHSIQKKILNCLFFVVISIGIVILGPIELMASNNSEEEVETSLENFYQTRLNNYDLTKPLELPKQITTEEMLAGSHLVIALSEDIAAVVTIGASEAVVKVVKVPEYVSKGEKIVTLTEHYVKGVIGEVQGDEYAMEREMLYTAVDLGAGEIPGVRTVWATGQVIAAGMSADAETKRKMEEKAAHMTEALRLGELQTTFQEIQKKIDVIQDDAKRQEYQDVLERMLERKAYVAVYEEGVREYASSAVEEAVYKAHDVMHYEAEETTVNQKAFESLFYDYIDGEIDEDQLEKKIGEYLQENERYPTSEKDVKKIMDALGSRGTEARKLMAEAHTEPNKELVIVLGGTYNYLKLSTGAGITVEIPEKTVPGTTVVPVEVAQSTVKEKIVDQRRWKGDMSDLNRAHWFLYPVIFVHGYSGSGKSWEEARKMLQERQFVFGGHFDLRGAWIGSNKQKILEQKAYKTLTGFKTGDFYTISFTDNDELTFYEQGKELKLVIDAVKAINKADKVILVGHSMGGLAARAYVQYPDLYENDVHALVTMATPHLGSFLGNVYDLAHDIKNNGKGSMDYFVQSDSKLFNDLQDYLKTKGIPESEFGKFRDDSVKFLSIVLATFVGIDISSPATKYLKPTSNELNTLNLLDIPLDIELVNVVSQFDLEKSKAGLLKYLKMFIYSDSIVDTTILPLYISFPIIKPLIDKKIKLPVQREVAQFLYEKLKSSQVSVAELYQWLQCDLFTLCEKASYPLNTYSDSLKINASDGVVPLASQLIYSFPLSRGKLQQEDFGLSKKLEDKTEVQLTDLFHIDVNKKKPEIVTWNAIKKFVTKLDPYKHIVFVIDSSGSMSTTDPNNIRITGPSILLNKLNKNTFVSVVDFDRKAKVKVEHKSIKHELKYIKQGFSSIDAKGQTFIAKGLNEGIKLALKYKEQPVIFLLTDGQDNGKTNILAIAESVSGKIPIYTVGLTGQVNEQLLSSIADKTLGKYFKAVSSQHLFSKLNIILSFINLEACLLNEAKRIIEHETQEFIVQISELGKKTSVVLSWMGSRIDLRLIKPDGTIVSSSGSNYKSSFFIEKNNVVAVIDPDQIGEWKVVIYGADIPVGGEDFQLSVYTDSDFIPTTAIRNQYIPGESIPLKVYLDKKKIEQANVSMIIEKNSGEKIDVSDKLSYSIIAEGDYKITTTINGRFKNGEKFNRIVVNEFHVALDKTNSLVLPQISMTMKWIQPGSFVMGDNLESANDCPSHNVTLSKGFWMAESEVTQAMWEKIMKNNPSEFKNGGVHPVESISYAECLIFLEKLSKLSGMRCRLPTEAEWEYACRAGTNTRFSWGDELMTDHVRNNEEWSLGHSPVKLFSSNSFGLFDMHSNVWEWCADWYNGQYYKNSQEIDPKGPVQGDYRVARGGAWCYGEEDMVSSKRTAVSGSRKLGNLGFRFVIDK